MARETKAQRLAREEQENLERMAEARAEWPARVMQALVDASTEGFELSAKQFETGQKFVVTWTDGYSDRHSAFLDMTPPTNPFVWSFLDDLENAVTTARKAREEAQRRMTLRSAALNKLSKEEREVLGL